MTQRRSRRTAADLEEWKDAHSFIRCIQQAAKTEPLFLSTLSKGAAIPIIPGLPRTVFSRAEEAGGGEVHSGVARLFAHYYKMSGRERQDKIDDLGTGSMGRALSRLPSPLGLHESSNLYLDAFLRSRSRLPWRPLTKAVGALGRRGCRPPDWRELVLDLSRWHHPRNRATGTPSVSERWWNDYQPRRT
ncbi:type I-E CRISPR-associated protein Cse2/CasB [Streptomyces sp. NPDC015350]|uniref:type I-E CRISPR-associated protein Cse2/CasB n=1 Tax=Streptomyces sp. NPDC015350 TaxID=3364955 RepID=UPI00370258E8